MYEQSIKDPQGFFGPLAKELLSWDHDFHTVKSGTLKNGDAAFLGGELNASTTVLIDMHLLTQINQLLFVKLMTKRFSYIDLR